MKEEKKVSTKMVLQDDEIKNILQEAAKQIPEEITMFHEIEKEKEIPKLPDTQNPIKAYRLYYGLYQKLLRKYLPKGDEYKKARKLIRVEANLFLKDGEPTGRDGKQAYTHIMQEAINMIIDWYNKTRGKDLFALYNIFKEMNQKMMQAKSKK